jgi:hypothetical protein
LYIKAYTNYTESIFKPSSKDDHGLRRMKPVRMKKDGSE